MNDRTQPGDDPNAITPLDGEAGIPSVTQAKSGTLSWKGIAAVALVVLLLVAVSAMAIHQWLFGGPKDPDAASKRMSDRPTAAATEPRKLDMSLAPVPKASAPTGPLIPAITPLTDDERAEPIGVRRTGLAGPSGTRAPRMAPEDAPVILVATRPGAGNPASDGPSRGTARGLPLEVPADATDPLQGTKRNLEGYQRQLQGLLDNLSKTSELATGGAVNGLPPTGAGPGLPQALAGAINHSAGAGLFGGQLQGSATPRVVASTLGNRSLTLPKGTAFTCALKTKVVSAVSGLVGCQVQRNVYSDDGRVLLIERGSHMDGEYRIASVRPGMVRIPVLWTRIRTPLGVTVDIDSPGTGALGESGIDGYVDNRWVERIGAAMLLSLIDDAVQITLRNESGSGSADTILLSSTTSNTSKLAEKVLDSTINIPPLIYQNQGGIVGIYVARDVDFSSVYELKAVSR
ncbi:MAG: type IV secretion system protein VirB10 [Vitreoscilla sp.]|nr:type IV secretion system protein VirB10 [Vitreoscilla sp.]